ncbi:3-dehydroquinate synthase [bacterium]|nr:3-dehydroquinate synthase [bacterium]
MIRISIELGNRSYPIHIASGILDGLGDLMLAYFDPDVPAIVITDRNVADIYLKRIEKSLTAAGFNCASYTIEPGELSKTITTVSKVYEFLIDNNTPRGGVVIGLGGGVVGDIAAFVASTFKRGVPYVAVPTSLLAQVDSSVGGKSGFDHRGQKNIVGTFYQPRFVLIDIDTLSTLPTREMKAGMAEVVKYGVILDSPFFSFLENNYEAVIRLDREPLIHVVAECCRLKATVVKEDELDIGARHVLNYGHTIAHALEACTGFADLLHGEAVSVGMLVAARVSLALSKCSVGDVRRQERLLQKIGLPTRLDPALVPQLIKHLPADKKRVANAINFVVCTGIGSAELFPITPESLVESMMKLNP